MITLDSPLLDNPIWNALSTDHLPLAHGDEHARRYPHEIGPLAGIPEQCEASYASLRRLAEEYPVVLFSLEPIRPTRGWTELRTGELVQMVRTSSAAKRPEEPYSNGIELRRLTPSDSPAMVALAELTEPGPFRLRTIELGNFYGIFDDGRLVSMAGKRVHLPGFIEVSGVCTHPEARGRGYARHLMHIVMDEIEEAGRTPFLHAWHDNPAIRLYEHLGFVLTRRFHLAVLNHIA